MQVGIKDKCIYMIENSLRNYDNRFACNQRSVYINLVVALHKHNIAMEEYFSLTIIVPEAGTTRIAIPNLVGLKLTVNS